MSGIRNNMVQNTIQKKRNYFRGIFVVVTLSCAILLVTLRTVFGGSGARTGTSGAQELLIPHGARGTALGGAVIADVRGAEAMYWNPAGAAGNDTQREVVFSHLDYIADMKYTYFGFLLPAGMLGNLGMNLRVLDIGDILVTREDAPDGTGEVISPEFITLGLVYSKQITDRVLFGSSLNILREKIMQETANGICFDFGFQYIPGISGFKLGLVLKNFGPAMRFGGADLDRTVKLPGDNVQAGTKSVRLTLAEFELPSYIQFGTSYERDWSTSNSVLLSAAFRNNSFTQDEVTGGIEFNFSNTFFLRGGYAHSSDTQYIYGATFGAGVNLRFSGSLLRIDYSIGQTKYFNNNQWITLKLSF